MEQKLKGISIKCPAIESYRSRKIVLLETFSIDFPVLSSKEYFDEHDRNEEFIDKYREKQ